MKILFVFDSKTGTSKTVAEMIAKEFPYQEIEYDDLREGESKDLSSFDYLVIGGSVRYGKLSKYLLSFLKNNEKVILTKPLAFYICCASASTAEDYIKELVPQFIKDHAVVIEYLGGELNPDRCNGFDKLVIKLARRYMETNDEIDAPSVFKTLPSILPEKISYFAEMMRQSLIK